MNCKNCGAENADQSLHCANCGAPVQQPAAAQEPVAAAPVLPEEYRPLSPWAYFGLSLLFSIPVVGFIFLIIFSCKKSNINRRNFALSYWIAFAICAGITVLMMIFMTILGFGIADIVSEMMYY